MSDKMRTSIRNKLLFMSVTIALMAVALLGFVSWQGFSDMKSSSDAISHQLVEVSAEINQRIISDQTTQQLSILAEATASTVDARVQNIMHQVEILANTIEELYKQPENFGRIPVLPPDASDVGEFVCQLVLSEHINMEDIADEVGLLGNMGAMMNQVTTSLTGASATYIGTASGFSIMSDDRPDLKEEMAYLDATTRTWYISAVETGDTIWTEVFDDAYGRGLAVTCAHPIYGPDGQVRGVVAIGCQLSNISSAVDNVDLAETGNVIVVDHNGDVVMGASMTKAKDGIVTQNSNLLHFNDPELSAMAQRIVDGETGIATVDIDGIPNFVAYIPMDSIPWTVLTMVSVEEVLAPVELGKAYTEELVVSAQVEADNIASATLIAMIAGMLASAVLALMVGLLYSNRIAAPIRRLEQGVREISRGQLDCKLDIKTGDEIENLATAFNNMTTNLKQYITDITSMTAEQERIGTELGVATEIQCSMLPSDFPAFPQYEEFDIYAAMIPAKEVGGDFYDFFLVGERHLGIVIADVSGKGVPAALFMVITKTLIKNYAQKGESPAEIMHHTNLQLCQNNDASMFVTAWMGILDLDTGELVYANAAHNHPLVRQKSGAFAYLPSDPAFILAGLDFATFEQSTLKLEAGDTLFLYTDGVTEATNLTEELYGEDRLLEILNTLDNASLKGMLAGIKKDIDLFVGEAPQFDDITMLALRFG